MYFEPLSVEFEPFQLKLDARHCERSEAIQKIQLNTGLLRFARNDAYEKK